MATRESYTGRLLEVKDREIAELREPCSVLNAGPRRATGQHAGVNSPLNERRLILNPLTVDRETYEPERECAKSDRDWPVRNTKTTSFKTFKNTPAF